MYFLLSSTTPVYNLSFSYNNTPLFLLLYTIDIYKNI